MKIREAVFFIASSIASIYDEGEAESIAKLLAEHITGYEPAQLLLKKDEFQAELSKENLQPFIERLLKHEPIQYIMKKAWFYGLELYIEPWVLIPRPETEELVDWVIKDIKASGKEVFEKKPFHPDETTSLKIMDVCTGSGCIALALKKTMPLAEVWGCDISDEAMNIARRNGSSLDIRVDFQGLDFLDYHQHAFLPSVDIAVCNPPYVPMQDKGEMKANVLDFEPHIALFVKDKDPLVFYRALAQYCVHRLHPHGKVYMEVHEKLAGNVAEIFRELNYSVTIRTDMQGKERMVRAMRLN